MNHPLYKHDYSVGTKWYRLTILSREGMYAQCRCECGKYVRVQARALGSGNTKSCGCIRLGKTNPNYRHGGRTNGRERLYSIWSDMLKRCKNKYEYYAHVKVCEEWHQYEVFRTWALLNGYSGVLQIDRIKNHLGYSPLNCRWVTSLIQSQNRRKTFRNNTSGYTGVYRAGTKNRPWLAMVFINNERIVVGKFKTPLAAHRARLRYIRNLQNEQFTTSNRCL